MQRDITNPIKALCAAGL